ncbi:MAG: inositol monophosphatase family protein [Phycisphaerales bacterium]
MDALGGGPLWDLVVRAVHGVDAGVTVADVRALLATAAPTPARGRCWTIDPLDGTKGYLRGGQFAIALALLEDGVPVVGVLGLPRLGGAGDGSGAGVLVAAARGRRRLGHQQPTHARGSHPRVNPTHRPHHQVPERAATQRIHILGALLGHDRRARPVRRAQRLHDHGLARQVRHGRRPATTLLHHRRRRKRRRVPKPCHRQRRRPHGGDGALQVARATVTHQRLR